MKRFVRHAGTAVALRRDGVDTDQIIPAEFCKRVTRTGYSDALFAQLRGQDGFPLDRPEHAGASLLLAGRDFGVGSSREHAVWALQDGGFEVLVASGFGDIFRRNALNNGLLPVDLPVEVVGGLMDLVEADPAVVIEVDLERCLLTWPGGRAEFEVQDRARRRLLEGLDAIDATLRHGAAIEAYERRRPARLPALARGEARKATGGAEPATAAAQESAPEPSAAGAAGSGTRRTGVRQ